MTPFVYQEELAKQGLALLLAHHIVYFAMEERTGKTLTAIRVAEQHHATKVLVITKKKALKGWEDTLAAYKTNKPFEVTTYSQLHKIDPKQRQLVILDEPHAYVSGYPKPGVTWKLTRVLTTQADIIYLSATPYAQGPQLLYHQFALSSFSPWAKFSNFYAWFKMYGKPHSIYVKGIEIPQYTKCDTELALSGVDHLFITKTRKELGFEHEPEDVVHWLELDEVTKHVYNTLVKKRLVQLKAGTLACESVAKLRASLHMLEGGCAKIGDAYIILANDEKIRFILSKWGDTDDMVIMYYYIAEGVKLRQVFKNAEVLQADSFAEGVDLSGYKHLIIYSQAFSTAKHSQRRARQANINRAEEILVHFLLVNKAISHQVYKAVSVNKVNYIDALYEGTTL